MNQLWVRISLTYVVIVIFLIMVPAVIYLTFQADNINLGYPDGVLLDQPPEGERLHLLARMIGYRESEILTRLVRILLSISLMGILVGVISSRGLAAPLNNLAKAARAVGSQDLSQRIEIKGSTEIREVAVAFNAMAEELEQAEELRSNMLAAVAHELRTPLTVIQGNLRAILDDVYELDKVEVARLYDQTRQLSRLVDDLHDLALLEANQFSLNLSSQNLIEIIHDVAAIYQPLIDDQDVMLELDLPDSISVVQADQARITQCINNLLNNTLRHTCRGGRITIRLSENKHEVSIAVKDDGAGIEPEHLPYIFDRFYRVDSDRNRRTGGSGLGLAITKELIQAHGGEISALSSGRGQGSEFIFSIPKL
jgi:signal transduction histidine kinase